MTGDPTIQWLGEMAGLLLSVCIVLWVYQGWGLRGAVRAAQVILCLTALDSAIKLMNHPTAPEWVYHQFWAWGCPIAAYKLERRLRQEEQAS